MKPMRNRLRGKVYLVGAGPGDIGLLTLKGKECVEKADVILYDYLANGEILSFAPPDAERVFMGKHGGGPMMSQDEINRMMVSMARKGKTVVRLKGGDPFIFGRGGEEAEVLARAGIPFEVVPGVSAGIAVPAYAGIPLTHRNYSSTVAFITGHEDSTKEKSSIAWDKISTGIDTLVIFMGITTLRDIVGNLIANGRSPGTPVAVIQWGTRAMQKTVTGTLSNIIKKTEATGIRPPGIIVIGKVVRLREKLKWFEERMPDKPRLFYTSFKTEVLETEISIAATQRGICRISFVKASSFLQELKRDYPDASIHRNERYFDKLVAELSDYLKGKPVDFTCKLDLHGSLFQKKVWMGLRKIPFGHTATYKEIAEMIGHPRSTRAIGRICGQNPLPIIVPCHRIIRSDGGLGGYSAGIEIKKALLKLEGTYPDPLAKGEKMIKTYQDRGKER